MNVLISGANRGLGLQLTRQCLVRGDVVYAGVHGPKHANHLATLATAVGDRLRIVACDVTHDASVRAFAAQVDGPVDRLINNAGVPNNERDGLEDLDADEAMRAFQANALGPVRLTRAVLPMLRRASGARIVNISSGLGPLGSTASVGGYGYRMSKAALNVASRAMANDLRQDGILVVALSPTLLQTDAGGADAPTPVGESALGILSTIEQLTLADSGGLFDFRGERLS